MSREGRGGGDPAGESSAAVAPNSFPQHFYPMMGYLGPQHGWIPPQPGQGTAPPWGPPWNPSMGYPAPRLPWSGPQGAATNTTTTSTATLPQDEYTVDTLRRIYKDDDGRVEIQRVKVQRRHPDPGAAALPGATDMSLVPASHFPLNERRPPPRKNKRKQQMQMVPPGTSQAGPYPWYPYMPYVPYPYPYPYYFTGCMWPPNVPPTSLASWSGNDDSERTSSRQDSLPATLDSQRLESRVSPPSLDCLSPRSPSPAGATDIHSIAPSDSVSVRGRKRETSLERALRGPTPPPRTKSRASSIKSSDVSSRSEDWMVHHALGTCTQGYSDKATSAMVVYKKIPPVRKRRKLKMSSDGGSLADLKDTDNMSDRVSEVSFDNSSRLSSELTYAFKKLEKSVDAFKSKVSVDSTPQNSPAPSPSIEIMHSSGEATPTDHDFRAALTSDVAEMLTKVSECDAGSRTEPATPNATDERSISPLGSITSLPALETARTASMLDEATFQPIPEQPPQPEAGTQTQLHADQPAVAPLPPLQVHTDLPAVAPQPPVNPAQTVNHNTTSVVELSEVSSSQEQCVDSSVTEGKDAQPTAAIPSLCSTEASLQAVVQGPESLPGPHDHTQQALTGPEFTSLVNAVPAPPASPPYTQQAATAAPEQELGGATEGGRESRTSTSTFLSARASDDPAALDTDSTDIVLPTTDTATADEAEEISESVGGGGEAGEGYQWVLQQPGETPDVGACDPAHHDERRDAWRAEVSLWRARLVVSLCRGRGLDHQDWATFHLLVHHPLTLDLKLSLLHALRLCAANSSCGAAVLRVALLHLAQCGEVLLQPEAARQPGWRSIKVDPSQPWAPVKGAGEILLCLGYRERDEGEVLRYPRRSGPEVSLLARLTLDLLVLAEELRLYLTGTHQCPANVSDLFFPTVHPLGTTSESQRPDSSVGSFVSAASEPVPEVRPSSRASSITTDDDTETLQASVRQVKKQIPAKRESSSEEEVTLKDDLGTKVSDSKISVTSAAPEPADASAAPQKEFSVISSKDVAPDLPLGSTVSLPILPDDKSSLKNTMTSLPDLQSIPSCSSLQQNRHKQESSKSSNKTTTPSATPTSLGSTDNPEEHIYEEIDVIRAQVQALRASSVPTEKAPPPLPPKKKISSGGEDDSGLSLTYPQVEWSSVSMPGSLRGGSTGARRKKRRAPMPPEFMGSDWRKKENYSENSPEATKAMKDEYRRSLNPFYEEIDSVKAKENESQEKKKADTDGNPFVEKETVVAGYIGKNPFYEDVEVIKSSDEYKKQSISSLPTMPEQQDGSVCAMGSLQELQDDAVVVRPKRRAPRPPPPTPQPSGPSTSHPTTPQPSGPPTSHPTTPQPSGPSTSHPTTPQPSDPPTPQTTTPQPPSPPVPQPSTPQPPGPPTPQPTTPQPPCPPTPQPIPQLTPVQSPPTPTPQPTVTQSHDPPTSQPTVTLIPQPHDPKYPIPPTPQHTATQPPGPPTQQPTASTSQKLTSQTSEPTSHLANTKEARDTPHSLSDTAAARETNTDPLINNVNIVLEKSDKNKLDKSTNVEDRHEETSVCKNKEVSQQNGVTLEEHQILSGNKDSKQAIDDTATIQSTVEIHPFTEIISQTDEQNNRESGIMAKEATEMHPSVVQGAGEGNQRHQAKQETEVKVAVAPARQHHKSPPLPPPFITPAALPPAAAEPPPSSPPLTPPNKAAPLALLDDIPYMDANEVKYARTKIKNSDTVPNPSSPLLRTSNVPFIDVLDLPPDCPPPPPPGPPPESPPETPHASPPETPHTSPPETPHTTPPDTPRASPGPSLLPDGDDEQVPPPIPPKAYSQQQGATGRQDALFSTEQKQPPSPTKNPPAASNTLGENLTEHASDPASARHSLLSSVSEERYEIPDTSLAPPPRPPPQEEARPVPPLATPQTPATNANPSSSDRYEIPEAAATTSNSVEPEAEERYEIPELVKETVLVQGQNGTPSMVSPRATATPRRGGLEAVFGPPKPPRRRKSYPPPPPRPPKNNVSSSLPISTKPPSTSSSSPATSTSTTPAPLHQPHTHKSSPKRRSWPFLLCNCLYVNCRNYDDPSKK